MKTRVYFFPLCVSGGQASRFLLLAAAVLLAPCARAACQGTVYLTFDTGNMSQAQAIADTLNQARVQATFFLAQEKTTRGDHALDASWKDYWRARVAEGHAFGNHTWGHRYLRKDLADGKVLVVDTDGPEARLDQREFCADLARVDSRFFELTGHKLQGLWRAPGGRTTQQTIRWAASCGYPLHVGWSDAGFIGDELSSTSYPNDVLLKRALHNIRPGDIIMMHLGIRARRDPLAPILAPLIQGLKDRGLCFAPLMPAG